jgi:uncharacterized membrane protein
MATGPNAPVGGTSTGGGLDQNVAGMLAYVTFIPAIIFLVVEPYSRNSYIRFHSFQSIFFNVAWIVLWMVLGIVATIPGVGWLTIFLWPLLMLGALVLWILLLVKAYSGSRWRLPVIGDLAEKQAGA